MDSSLVFRSLTPILVILLLYSIRINSLNDHIAVPAHPQDEWHAANFATKSHKQISPSSPLFCFVIRTYWGHGDAHGGSLRRLIRSIQRQNHSNWEAILLVADSKPFTDVHTILRDINDTRVWIFAEWIGEEFTPKKDGEWMPDYHGILYNLTDDAIHVCPPQTKWLVVTNGDNLYADTFMNRVLLESSKNGGNNTSPQNSHSINNGDSDGSATHMSRSILSSPDIIAFDFYSRYMRSTFPACDRFSHHHIGPFCKRNKLQWCQSDLGAAALDYQRFLHENRRFGDLNGSKFGLDAEHFDGIMMETLSNDGWAAVHVTESCLFVHSPSIQSCAWHGGVWDDTDIVKSGGGECISIEEAAMMLHEKPDEIEQVLIDEVANDGRVEAFLGATQSSMRKVKCLRRKDYASKGHWGKAMLWFSNSCTDSEDLDTFYEQLDVFYPTEEDLQKAQDSLVV